MDRTTRNQRDELIARRCVQNGRFAGPLCARYVEGLEDDRHLRGKLRPGESTLHDRLNGPMPPPGSAFANRLRTRGISEQGAAAIASGNRPHNSVDRLLVSNALGRGARSLVPGGNTANG